MVETTKKIFGSPSLTFDIQKDEDSFIQLQTLACVRTESSLNLTDRFSGVNGFTRETSRFDAPALIFSEANVDYRSWISRDGGVRERGAV